MYFLFFIMYMAFYVINTLVVVLMFIVFCGFKVMEFLMFILKLLFNFQNKVCYQRGEEFGEFFRCY